MTTSTVSQDASQSATASVQCADVARDAAKEIVLNVSYVSRYVVHLVLLVVHQLFCVCPSCLAVADPVAETVVVALRAREMEQRELVSRSSLLEELAMIKVQNWQDCSEN